MNISDEGLKLIKSFEGFHKMLPDGRCTAYQGKYKDKHGKEHLDIPTIGWGCTEGVEMGMIWTTEEAEVGLRRELAKHEAAVLRVSTVAINQNQFDAMVALSYNVGTGALQKSTLVKRLNRGDVNGAAAAFELFNSAYGGVQPGLVSRRKREAALFLKPTTAPVVPAMPQRVAETPEPLSRKVVATGTALASSGVAVVTTTGSIPAPPPALIDTVSNVSAWKGLAGHSDPFVIVGVLIVAGIFGVPYLIDKWRNS